MFTSNTLPQTTLAPKAQLFTLALAVLVAPTTTAFSAVGTDYINDGAALLVPVGDAGNAPDPANTDGDNNSATGFGGVPYGYGIGKYEVTNAQYVIFLNAVDPTGGNNLKLYNTNMGSATWGGITYDGNAAEGYKYTVRAGNDSAGVGWADKPVNYVSFWDAARFCNWLTNGGTVGVDTETGVYTLDGGGPNPTNSGVTRNVAVNGSTLTGTGGLSGKSGTVYAVPSGDEWYKAAYYSPNQGGQGEPGYWTYPTQSNSISKTDANYANTANNAVNLRAVGSYYEKGSYYGTFDQGGNVFEWNDTIMGENSRSVRGASHLYDYGHYLSSSTRFSTSPDSEYTDYGFRISSLIITSVPEPGTYGLLGGAAALLGAIALRRRHRRD